MSETRSGNELMPAINHLLRQRIDEATEEVVSKAVADFETRLRREIAKTSMEVANFYEVDQNRGVLTIRVKTS